MFLSEGLTQNKLELIEETLKDFVALIPRWKEVKGCELLEKKFCSRNRNPIFDISNTKYFKTKLGSKEGLTISKPVEDHYIQRTKAIKFIFNKLEENPQMKTSEFLRILKKYCSTVCLTDSEHKIVTKYCKKNPQVFNYQAYEACGIRIQGLSEIILAD